MTRTVWSARVLWGALLGSGGLLLTAMMAEHFWGLAPCPLCLWQRAGHLLALVSFLWLRYPSRLCALPGIFGTGLSALVGTYHLGSERGWWAAPGGCTGAPDLSGMSPEGALELMMRTIPARCDEVVWSLAGLSMAGWNAAISGTLLALWVGLWAVGRAAPLNRSDH